MASTFRQQSLYDPAVEYLLRAIELLESLPDSAAQRPVLNIIRQKLANTYLVMDDDSFAHRIYLEIIPAFRTDSNEWNLAISQGNHAEVLRRMERLPEAFESVEEALSILRRFDNADYLAYALRTKANVAQAAGRPRPEVRSYFEAAMQNTRYPDNAYGQFLFSDYLRFLATEGLLSAADSLMRTIERLPLFRTANFALRRDYHRHRALVYRGLGRWKEGTEAALTATAFADSLNRFILLIQAKGLQERYKSQTFEQEARMSQLVQVELERKIRISNLNLLVSVLCVLVLFIVAFYYRLQLRFKAVRLCQLEEEHRASRREQEWPSVKRISQQQVIRRQLEQLVENARQPARRNEELEAHLGNMQDKGSQKLKNAVLQLKEGMQQRDSLMLRFNESYPSFIPRLKERFPDLTQNDLEFCALVRLNLSYKDIANVMNIRHQSVFTKKYRITQKMKVEEDTGFQQVILET